MMETLSVIVALAALATFLAGCTGMVRPPMIRLRRRRHAAAMAGFAFVVMGCAVDLDPPPGQETGPIGPQILVAWAFCVIAAWGVLRIARAVRMERENRPTLVRPVDVSPLPPVEPVQPFWNAAPEPDRPISKPKLNFVPPPPRGRSAPSISRTSQAPSESGTTASFTYVDQHGVVTDRMISNWRSEGPYIRGFCLDKLESRTFRKDRIEDWRA